VIYPRPVSRSGHFKAKPGLLTYPLSRNGGKNNLFFCFGKNKFDTSIRVMIIVLVLLSLSST